MLKTVQTLAKNAVLTYILIAIGKFMWNVGTSFVGGLTGKHRIQR